MPACLVPTASWGTVTVQEPVPAWEDAPRPRPTVPDPSSCWPDEDCAEPWTIPSSLALLAEQLRAPPSHATRGARDGGGDRALG